MRRFELKSLVEYTDEAVLEEIRRVARLHGGGPFTRTAFELLSPRVSSSTIRHRFGSWQSALQKAGLQHFSKDKFLSAYEEQLRRGRAMSDEELLDEMRRVYRLSGSSALRKSDFDRLSFTRYDVVRERLGWHEALKKAGIPVASLGKRYTDEECFENVAQLWTHYGRQPHHAELKAPPSTVGPKAYILRWGTWREALNAFVKWAAAEEQDVPADLATASSATSPCPAEGAAILQEDRHDIPLRLRWKVLMRDRFRCKACGRSPASDLSVELHVDHIDAWADGGKTVLENLQTLCQHCNLGKGKSFAKVD